MNNTLVVFLRKAVKGQVKTRLALGIGEEMALSVYQWLVSLTLDAASRTKADVHLYFDQMDNELSTPESFSRHEQKGNDLGERMFDSFKNNLSDDASKKLIIIGSDCPEINEQLVEEAFQKLSEKDLVIGPAIDGGFYLLGLKKLHVDLFKGIEWGGENVLRQLVTNATSLNLTMSSLEPKRDIDDASDLRWFKDQYQSYCLKELSNVAQG